MVKINTLYSKHKLFQQRLEQLADKPKSLQYVGNIFSPETPAIAIVGSRKPTAYGQEMTYRLAYDLAQRGVVIISGLALGVDGIAHQAALDAHGATVAVLGGGVEQVYPYRHRKLAAKIVASGGALISEYPASMPPLPHQFIARNRLIAALGEGTIVTEAAAKSGSLHTAQFALELGRQVMAVPGQATNPLAEGCLNLLKTGAHLVANAEDALFALGYQTTAKDRQLPLLADSAEEEVILALLQQGIQSGEELQVRSQLTPALYSQTMTMLEIGGKIKPLGGNQWMMVR